MKQVILTGMAMVCLAACAPRVPDSGPGFSDYQQYEIERAQREAQLNGRALGAPVGSAQSLPAAPSVATSSLSGGMPAASAAGQTQAIPSSSLAQAGIGTNGGVPLGSPTGIGYGLGDTPPSQTALDENRTMGVQAGPGNAPPPILNNPGISDEQDFSAVASRETIQSDKDRLAANAANYEVIQPTAVPTREGDAGPNIVEYAINAPNVKGQEWYSRFRLSGANRAARNCADYTSADEAQRDFLRRGGPDKDPRGIDPDGDGFACAWDPAPFKLARSN